MQTFYKDDLILEAIKSAISAFGKKNNLNGMDYFAEQLGYNGQNRSIQLHNRLSPANQEKFLKLEELFFIMAQMDKEEHKTIVDAIANKFGFYAKEKEHAQKMLNATIETIVTIGTLEIGDTLGSVHGDVAQAIKDGIIDEAEAKRLLRSIRELHEKMRGVEDALRDKICI